MSEIYFWVGVKLLFTKYECPQTSKTMNPAMSKKRDPRRIFIAKFHSFESQSLRLKVDLVILVSSNLSRNKC